MRKVCVYDMKNDGHHYFYNKNIMNKNENVEYHYFTSSLEDEMKLELEQEKINIIQNKFKDKSKNERYRYEIFNLYKGFKYCKKNRINTLIIAHLDSNIVWLYFFRKIFKNIAIIGVEHWYPNNEIKKRYLDKLVEKIVVVVHTKDVLSRFSEKSKKNIKLINYPVMKSELIETKVAKEYLGIDKEKFTLLYFGGTRKDKGIDLLLEALKSLKKEVFLVIAGKEEAFSKEFIINELKEAKMISYKIDLHFIEDDDIKYYFSACDSVVIPYRKYFNGESGIFTEGINYGKPVIAPNIIHFLEIIKKENNGQVFECENTQDLSEKIEIVIENYEKYLRNALNLKVKYQCEHSIENFKEIYGILINENKEK